MHGDAGPTLIEAAPFIEGFGGAYVVIKLGGELFDRRPLVERLVPQIAVLFRCGLRPVLVHGGGQQIDLACVERGIAVEKRAGRRITSAAVLEVVLDVVARQINADFCQRLTEGGVRVRGFADGASRAILCRRRPAVEVDGEAVDFGEVGDVDRIDPEALFGPASPVSADYVVPVLPCIGAQDDGAWVNVNADSVASAVAVHLGAQKLIMLSRVPGVLTSEDAAGPISQLDTAQAEQLIDSGVATGGMRAKLGEALRALRGGVAQVHVISGVEPQTLLREIFTAEGCGTLITSR